MVNPKLDSLYQHFPTPLRACRLISMKSMTTKWWRLNMVRACGWSCSHLFFMGSENALFYGPQEWRKWIWALNFEGSPMNRWRADFSAHLIDRLAISAFLRRYQLTGTDHLSIKEHSRGSKFPDIDTFLWSLVSAYYNRRILSAL